MGSCAINRYEQLLTNKLLPGNAASGCGNREAMAPSYSMSPFQVIARWLDIRPNEVRAVTFSFASAFLIISFLIAARSIREALYLTAFDVKTLPYITGAVAILSVPTVGVFAGLLRFCRLTYGRSFGRSSAT